MGSEMCIRDSKKISAKGKYKLTGAYSGSETAKASTGKVSFKVK